MRLESGSERWRMKLSEALGSCMVARRSEERRAGCVGPLNWSHWSVDAQAITKGKVKRS